MRIVSPSSAIFEKTKRKVQNPETPSKNSPRWQYDETNPLVRISRPRA